MQRADDGRVHLGGRDLATADPRSDGSGVSFIDG
jgi:hypothetical protein